MATTKAPKETAVTFDVLGYAVPRYGSTVCVLIRVSGTGPRGKIKALAYVGRKPFDGFVQWEGDGQYSPMHGNSSMHKRDGATDVPGLTAQVVSDVAAKWVAENPKAFYEYRVATAKIDRYKAVRKVEDLREQILKAESALRAAVDNLGTCEADIEVVFTGLAPDKTAGNFGSGKIRL